MNIINFVPAGIFVVGDLWFLICNNWTLRDRLRLNSWVHEADDWIEKSRVVDSVSYWRHLWARFLLTNPWRLYDFGPSLSPPSVKEARG